MTTISQVAEYAGVSRTTVSHVLNHVDRVSPAMRARVLQAIEALGYEPNPQARSLRTGRTSTVAMLIPDILNPFYTELVKAVQLGLDAAGLDTLIFNTDVPGGHSQEHGREYLRQIRRRRVDGVIISDYAVHGMYDALDTLDIPAVFVGDLPSGAIDSIAQDDYGGGHMMGRYLAEAGHRRIAIVTGPSYFKAAMARATGFAHGFAEHGGEAGNVLRFEGTYLPPSGREAVAWLLDVHGGALPSAVFFSNYLMALGALAAFYDRGTRIPDDIAMAVFSDLPRLDYVRPNLTRVGVSPAQLAGRAAAMLVDRLNRTYDGPPRADVIPCTLHRYDTA